LDRDILLDFREGKVRIWKVGPIRQGTSGDKGDAYVCSVLSTKGWGRATKKGIRGRGNRKAEGGESGFVKSRKKLILEEKVGEESGWKGCRQQ